MKRRVVIAVFAAVCVAQLAVAASMIWRYESALKHGTLFKIRVAPVDPVDPFRGRYVAVFPQLVAPEMPEGTDDVLRERLSSWNERVYAQLETDSDGFASVVKAQDDPPDTGDYLEATTAGIRFEPAPAEEGAPARPGGYNLRLPFDRYYMKETLAPRAEDAYREAARAGLESKAWLVVRVRNGLGAVEGLYIDGVPIEEAAAARKVTEPPR